MLADAPRLLFEATFQADGVLIRADLLLPVRGALRMAKVKSSASVKEYQRIDAAVQGCWVVKQTGLPLSRIAVAHVGTAFAYPGDGD